MKKFINAYRTLQLNLAVLLCLSMVSSLASGSAWPRPEGNLLILAPVSYTYADESFDDDGDRVDRNRFEMAEFSPMIEYGVTRSFTIGMQPKYREVWVEMNDGRTKRNSGLAESDFYVRQQLWSRDQASLSLQVGAKVPISPDENDEVPIGRDQVDGDIKLAYGNRRAMGSGRIFYSGELGYTKRWDTPKDAASLNGFVGWAPGGSNWAFIMRLANTVSVGNNQGSETEVLTAFPDYTRHDVQLMTSYRFSKSLSLVGGVSTTYAGENVGIGNTAFVALSRPFAL